MRPATEADLPLVEEAERAYVRDVEPGQLAAWTAALDRNRALWREDVGRTTVLEVEGETAGFVAWTPADGAALVVTVQVLPPFRRRGYGRRLLEACAAQAAAAGHGEVRLGVHRDNPARALYASAGFAPAGEDGECLLLRRAARAAR
ncbi:Ribosomal protein S18 acetylase RimI [Geodermatophilus telluris]|uniref:Ribosomal protein S18 acetylase RimI n=1 Tax=Geodermatophilus telluris TaxID=1190417 RepID=A0A1G6MN39_9ACTN|nr:GNAT family N-acetyltransferase [Geodermatophilus telluris]SDC56930.1 Ribosomal protein S18 acetylase RimI [Geodermatophilus telluris]